jgi:large subunit ribosomal protein L25
MAESLAVTRRETTGKRRNRRLRQSGKIPAVLYGHGQASVSLAVSADALEAAMRHGAKLVDLTGAVSESALLKELQWDTFGTHLLHVDFARTAADERIEVQIAVVLRGEAPGTKEGGVVEHLVHEVEIECPAAAIPDRLEVNINSLALGQLVTAGQLKLPAGAKLVGDPEKTVVQCVEPAEEEEAEPGIGESVEPEVIGRKAEEEEESA